MAVRSTMAALITRVRLLINDPAGASQQFADQDIQDVMDASRNDVTNAPLTAYPVYSGSTISYLDYYSDGGDWETGYVIKQYRTITVTPSSSEPIVGHFTFAQSTLPPLYITGSQHSIYRAAADLLERWAARWTLSYNVNVDGQSLQRSQAMTALLALAKQYRMQQQPGTISAMRTDLNDTGQNSGPSLQPTEIDYMS